MNVQNESSFPTSVNALQCGFLKCLADDGWTVIYANDIFYKIIEYTSAEFKEKFNNKIISLVHPDDVEKTKEYFSCQSELNTAMDIEYRLIAKSGRIVSVSDKSVFVEENGQKLFYCTYNDITELKNAVTDLRAMRERLSAAIAHAGMNFWEFNMDTNTLENSFLLDSYAALRKGAQNPEEYIHNGFVHPVSVADYIRLHEDMRNGIAYSEKQIRLGEKYGGLWYLVRYTNTFDDSCKPVKAYATALPLDSYKELEERFAISSQQEGLVVWTYDIKSKQINNSDNVNSYSPGAPKVIDNVPEEIYFDKKIHPDDLKFVKKCYNDIIAGEKSATATYRYWNEEAHKYLWWKVYYTNVFDRLGNPIKAVGTAKDITTQIEAEEKYAAMQNYHRLNCNNALIYSRINITKNYCYEIMFMGNDITDRFPSHTVDELLDKAYIRIPDIKELNEFKQLFTRMKLKEGYSKGLCFPTLEHRFSFEGSYLKWVRTTAEIVQNPYSNDLEIILEMNDIDLEHNSKAVIERLIDFDYEYIAKVDIFTGKVDLLAEKNRETLFYLDYSKTYSENCNIIVKKSVEPGIRADFLKEMNLSYVCNMLKSMPYYSCRFPLLNPNGTTCYKCWKFSYLDDNKNTLFLARTDVTDNYDEEQWQKEALRSALKKAEAANEAKSDFLSRMSHDMRTPLNGILGLVSLTLDEELSGGVRDNLKKINTSGKYLLSLINDTLDMNKIKSNRVTLHPEPVHTSEFIDSITASIKPTFEAKHIELKIVHKNIDLCYINIDKVRVQQIFSNILSNAAKFTPDGGKVELTLECLHRTEKLAHDKIVIRDNGIGMSKEFLPKLFEPFAQEQNKLTSNYAGTGLGMPIVKNLIDLMGGRIEVTSEKGVGTEVTVWIDFERLPNYVPEKHEEPANDLHFEGKRVLLCDDHPLNVEIAKRLLQKQGFIVFCAINGKIGVEMFASSPVGYYNAILMDIRMPEMDGLEAARTIRELKRGDAETIPIIAMTANAFEDDVRKSFEAGMNEHLAKPIEPQKLFEVLKKNIYSK